MCAVRTHTHTLINIIHKYESFTPAVPSQYVAAAAGPPPQSTSRVPAKSRHTTWRVLLEICCIPTWDGLATPVPEVRDFWKKASYEWRRRLASASRLALRWPLLPPFARRQCPRLTPAQRPEVCHPPRVLMAHVRPTATPAHLSRCLSGMASRSDLYAMVLSSAPDPEAGVVIGKVSQLLDKIRPRPVKFKVRSSHGHAL